MEPGQRYAIFAGCASRKNEVPEVIMRTRLTMALAAASLAALPARADVLQASATTLVTAGQSYRDGQLERAIPVYELVTVSATEMKTGWGEFEATLAAWGAVDAGPIRFWQNGAPAGSRASGDVDVGYLRGDVLGRRLTFRLGRQVVVEGSARMIHLDGGQLVLRLPAGFGLSAWGGVPVSPRFDARGGELALQGTRADVAYGGRVSWGRAGLLEVGASAAIAEDGSEVSRQDVGADLRLTPVHALELTGSGFYSIAEKRVGQVQAGARLQAHRTFTVFADYQHVEPDLFLPRNSILAVFAAEKRDDVGGGLRWTPRRTVDVDAEAFYLKEPEGNGRRARVRGTLRPYGLGAVGAEVQVLKIPENGYLQGRLFGQRDFGRISATLDLWIYRYENKVNDQSQSLGGTVTGGYQIDPAWRVTLAATAGSDPLYKSRAEVMAKLVWNQTFLREVR